MKHLKNILNDVIKRECLCNELNMKTDRYFKVVLTVIAVCLVILTLQNMNILPRAQAEGPIAPIPNYALCL